VAYLRPAVRRRSSPYLLQLRNGQDFGLRLLRCNAAVPILEKGLENDDGVSRVVTINPPIRKHGVQFVGIQAAPGDNQLAGPMGTYLPF